MVIKLQFEVSVIPGEDFDISEKECECKEYDKRRIREATNFCEARTFVGNCLTSCAKATIISLNNGEIRKVFCVDHIRKFMNHQACAHCHRFLQSGFCFSCSPDLRHISHVNCTIRYSKSDLPVCSHCCAPASKYWLSGARQRNPQELNLFNALDRKDLEELERIAMKMTLDCGEIGIPSSFLPILLVQNLPSIAKIARNFLAPITEEVLTILAKYYTDEIWEALAISPSYHFLLKEEFNGETAISLGIRENNWEYVLKLIEHFDYRSVDVDMQAGRDRRTIRELAQFAPKEVQEALKRAATISNYSRELQSQRILRDDISRGTERFPIRVINDVDDAIPVDFIYSTRVVDRTGILKQRKTDEMLICNCRSGCEIDCECNSGVYEEDGRARLHMLEAPFLECSSDCLCNMACGNRVAQKGATHPIEIFRTADGRGWGVRALSRIRKGTFIGEYTGELLTDAEANRRVDSYLFETSVGEANYTVDACCLGNFTRFINHSCEPNAKVCMVVWDWQTEQLSHICIFAVKEIYKGQEITISYGEHWWRAKITEFSCQCKSPICEFTETKRAALLRKQAETCSTSSSCYDSEAASE